MPPMTLRTAVALLILLLLMPLRALAEDSPAPRTDAAPLLGDSAEVYANGESPAEAVPAATARPAYRDLWDRIRGGFTLRDLGGPLVQRHENWYAQRPGYVQRMLERSRRYLYYVVEELEKRHMPTEIALLPMIESSYDPQALSAMRAAGIWQFIPSTGRKYGLEQNFWYDARRDVLAATRAALDYLQFLYATFGDWELALAAYNWGEGAVQRAIAHNQARREPTDYESLHMPAETRNYLPKLQAVKNLIAEPRTAGITLDPIPNEPYFTVVDAPRQIDLKKAAQLAGLSMAEFRSLNPAHNRPVITAPSGGAASLVVPADRAEAFAANLQRNADPLVTWQAYALRKGERLDTVARRFGISDLQLKQVNGLKPRSRVRPGQMLLVPGPREEDEALTSHSLVNANFTLAAEDPLPAARRHAAASVTGHHHPRHGPAAGKATKTTHPAASGHGKVAHHRSHRGTRHRSGSRVVASR